MYQGTGSVGTGGFTPTVLALDPSVADNPNFTLAIWRGLGGAQAVLVIDESDPGPGPAIPATASFALVETVLQASGAGAVYGYLMSGSIP